MKFQNQAAINQCIKTIKSTFSRYNNWAIKYEELNAKREEIAAARELGVEIMSRDERNAFFRAWGAINDRVPSHPRYGGEAYVSALYWIPQVLRQEHGIEMENSRASGGAVATAQEILAILGEDHIEVYKGKKVVKA